MCSPIHADGQTRPVYIYMQNFQTNQYSNLLCFKILTQLRATIHDNIIQGCIVSAILIVFNLGTKSTNSRAGPTGFTPFPIISPMTVSRGPGKLVLLGFRLEILAQELHVIYLCIVSAMLRVTENLHSTLSRKACDHTSYHTISYFVNFALTLTKDDKS